MQQQRSESPAATLTWHASKYKVHELNHRYILCRAQELCLVEVAALVSPALTSLMVSVDVKQHLQHPLHGRPGSRSVSDTSSKDRFFLVLPSHHLCTLVTAYMAFVCTARTKIVAHVKDPMSTFDANPQTEHNNG